MSDTDINTGRRRFLVAATSTVGAVGVAGLAVPFLKSWQPSAKAKAAGAPVSVNVDKIAPGQQIIVAWQGKPVFIVHRTAAMLERLKEDNSRLRDPKSDVPNQPVYVKNAVRSMADHEAIFVVLGVCTHLGCSPKFVPQVGPMDFDENWPGGYHCPCHGSKFDLAGRVFKGVPAPSNLNIPPYSYKTAPNGSHIVVIGVGQDTAKESA